MSDEPTLFNRAPVDAFTAMHLGTGTVVGAAGAPWQLALALTVGWELVEPKLKRSKLWRKRFPVPTDDTLANTIGDSGAFMAGWWLGKQIRERRDKAKKPPQAPVQGANVLNLPIRRAIP